MKCVWIVSCIVCLVSLGSADRAASQTLNITASVSAPSGQYNGTSYQTINIWGASSHSYQITSGAAFTNYTYFRAYGLTTTLQNKAWGSGAGFNTLMTNALGVSNTIYDSTGGYATFDVGDGIQNGTAIAVTSIGSTFGIANVAPSNPRNASSDFSIYGEG